MLLLWTSRIAGGRAHGPGRKHHGTAGTGSSLQNRFYAANQGDHRAYAGGTLGRENDDCVAFMHVRQ